MADMSDHRQVAAWTVLFAIISFLEGTFGQSEWPESASGSYRFGSVTADNDLCSAIGTAMLARHGGSAVDAAIATLVCLGAVNAQSSGIGGGFILTIYEGPSKQVQSLIMIARETAPLFAHPDMFEADPDGRVTGPLSIMVPREIYGYWEAWRRYGRVSWDKLFEDTIRLCRDGWPVSQHMANAVISSLAAVQSDPGLSEQYLRLNGDPFEAGETMTDPKLANTLEIIANEGPAAFYNGSLSQIIVDELHAYGATSYTLADLESPYAVPMWYEPLMMDLPNGNYKMWAPTTPSSGPLMIFIMRILDGFGFTSTSFATPDDRALFYHRTLEAFKFAFARRPYLGDIEFANQEVLDWIDLMTNASYCSHIQSLIDDDYVLEDYGPWDSEVKGSRQVLPKEDPGVPEQNEQSSTTHLNVMAGDGMAVGATATVGAYFGSKTRGTITGIVYNNMMSLFNTPTSTNISHNWVEPLKRGRSSTVPVLILDDEDEVRMLAGGAGGPKIITSTTMLLENFLWLGMDTERSVSAPTLNDENTGTASYEAHTGQEEVGLLALKGHNLEETTTLAVEQALTAYKCPVCWNDLLCKDTCIEGVSDWRKWGAPDGY